VVFLARASTPVAVFWVPLLLLKSKLGDECRDASRQKQLYKADDGGLPKTETVYPLVPREPV
jgi:hypothetical protein